ncbi:hypothetical protein ACQUY5_16560 [Bacillus cereus]|uniref:hypothetical protein n=1 Tax=Bacillus cereus TaxID=1396 RepID=UPI003D162AA2
MLKLETNYMQKNGEIVFHSAQLTDAEGETVLFQVNNVRVFQDFLDKAGIELNQPSRSVVGSIVVTNEYELDYKVEVKLYTSKSEVPFNANFILTVVDSITVEGWLLTKDNVITIYHPSKELGVEGLKQLAFELFKKRGTDISDVPVFLIDFMQDNTYYRTKRGI